MTSRIELSLRDRLDRALIGSGTIEGGLVIERKPFANIDVQAVTSTLVGRFEEARLVVDRLKNSILDPVHGLPSIVAYIPPKEKGLDFFIIIDPEGEIEPRAYQTWTFHRVDQQKSGKDKLGHTYMKAALTVSLTGSDFRLTIGEEEFVPEQLSTMDEEELQDRIVTAYLNLSASKPSPRGRS